MGRCEGKWRRVLSHGLDACWAWGCEFVRSVPPSLGYGATGRREFCLAGAPQCSAYCCGGLILGRYIDAPDFVAKQLWAMHGDHFATATALSIVLMAVWDSAARRKFVDFDDCRSAGRADDASEPNHPSDRAANICATIAGSFSPAISRGTVWFGSFRALPRASIARVRVCTFLSKA